jgi:hypothetical protein
MSALALGVADPATAHDTWFEPAPATARGELGLVLGTGTQYPAFEFPIRLPQLAAHGCRAEGVPAARLAWVADRPDALALRSAQPLAAARGVVCWAQLQPIELDDIGPETVALYLDEINAPPAVRAAWAAQQARGVRWHERYVKHARIEIDAAPPAGAAVPAAAAAPPARPVPMGMDALLTAPRRPVRAGDALEFQVLRDGAPLAGQAIEFRSDLSRFGIWRRTDAEGRVRFTPPLPARWLLRGVDLRPADGERDRWDSRFLTLVFDVVAKDTPGRP